MPRPKIHRRVHQPPIMKGYKPFGIPACTLESIKLTFEEYESIRLVSYEMHSQEEAAELMQVSRPTLTRIYNQAIHNIAKAFAEGKGIEIEGGNYKFDSDWYRCRKCHKLVEGVKTHVRCGNCPDYKMDELIRLNL